MKIGNNDPCSCGSGKKFKKCCMLKVWSENKEAQDREDMELDAWLQQDWEEGVKNLIEVEKNKIVFTSEIVS